jgi:molybdate/tungstate transport system substrate-binding protein
LIIRSSAATAALAAALLLTLWPAAASEDDVVSVLYAGSLVTAMEGPIKGAVAQQGIDFQGEGAGSVMLANLIAAGARQPDIFISVDPELVTRLGAKVARSTTFASTSLGIGWSDKSKYASLFARVAARKMPVVAALSTPGLAIGRTDPQLDLKGVYTVQAMTLLAGAAGENSILGAPENNAQVFPEEDLLVRIDTGPSRRRLFLPTPVSVQ